MALPAVKVISSPRSRPSEIWVEPRDPESFWNCCLRVRVFGPTRHVHTLLVGGAPVVDGGELRTADAVTLASDLARASARMREAA